jgi:hypothetical protein
MGVDFSEATALWNIHGLKFQRKLALTKITDQLVTHPTYSFINQLDFILPLEFTD